MFWWLQTVIKRQVELPSELCVFYCLQLPLAENLTPSMFPPIRAWSDLHFLTSLLFFLLVFTFMIVDSRGLRFMTLIFWYPLGYLFCLLLSASNHGYSVVSWMSLSHGTRSYCSGFGYCIAIGILCVLQLTWSYLELQKSLPTPRDSGESHQPSSMQSMICPKKRILPQLSCIARNLVDYSIRDGLL